MKKGLMILIALVFLAGCIKVGSDNKLPDYLKEPIEKEIKTGLDKELADQQQQNYEKLFGIFVNQGIILNKEGGSFEIKVKNNELAGNLKIEIEKSKTVSGNDINFEVQESSFYIGANLEKTLSIIAKPVISGTYKYKQDFFPVKIIASKNEEYFSEANIIIMINL